MLEYVLLGGGLALIAYAFYKWATQNNSFFADRNLPYIKPTFLLGNTGTFFLMQHRTNEYLAKLYNSHPTEKWFGMFDFRSPIFFLRSPETIKQLIVKDFDHFEDHMIMIDETVDDMFGNSLFMMRGEKWRDMRATLSPAFTGSKMRQMFELVRDCATGMVEVFDERASEGERIQVEMKELFGRYTSDVIASSAFGIVVNSFRDEQNDFFVMGKKMMKFSTVKFAVKFMLLRMWPWIMRTLDIQFIDGVVRRFFQKMVMDNISIRHKEGIFRPDMIHLLMQLKTKSKITEAPSEIAASFEVDSAGFATVEESAIGKQVVQREWSDNEIVAQCFLFFVAGFDTSSTCLSFLAYELAINPEIQDRLYEECMETKAKLGPNGKLSYDVLQKMKYMDQVVSEILRLWPPVMIIDRNCVKDYEFIDGDRKVLIKTGTKMWIPVYSIMQDPQYYPEPSKFNPDRFSDENKDNIVAGSYLPFGVGPRNCIGSRFALMEVKAVVYYLLLKFRIVPDENTQIPIKLTKSPGGLQTEKGFQLELKPRS